MDKYLRSFRKLARLINFEPRLVNKRVGYAFAEPSIFVEYVDNKLNPERGFLTLLSAKAMIPFDYRQDYIFKILYEQSFYFPLSYGISGGFRLRLGHIFNTDFARLIPIERFYLGGAYSLRGYEPDMAPPVNFLPNGRGDLTCVVPTGGRSMANMNLEVKFPIYDRFKGVIFNDMGVLAQNQFSEIIGGRWLGATGIGLRYNSVVGPVRLDIGWKWKKRFPADRSFAWFFTMGEAF